MKLAELMAEFAEKFGIDGFVPDKDDVYHLDADGMAFAFADAEDGAHFVIWAEVCPVPPEGRERLYDILMQSMFMGRQTSGAYFSVHDGTIYLHQIEALADMNLERFKVLLEKFINTYETWRSSITDFNSVLPELTQKVQEQELEARSFEAMGFMRV